MRGSTAGITLSFTELRVSDWERTLRWYVEVLGLKVVREDADHRFALLEAGGGRLSLKGSDVPVDRPANCRLVFQVEDVDREGDRLRALGEDVTPSHVHEGERYREIRLFDPEGVPLTLFCWLDAPTPPGA